MMNKTLKRALSFVLTLVLVFQLLPLNAFAAEVRADTTTEENNLEIPKQEEPDVVGEVEELRDRTSKQFRLSDGSFAAVNYGIPVHYLDDNNNWVDVDNTLTYSNSAEQYLSVNGDEQRGFADTLANGQPVLVSQYENYGVEISLLPLTYETAAEDTAVEPESVPEATEEPEPEVTEPVTEATVPEETVPETTAPEETVPETTVPDETVPEVTIPEGTEPEATEPTETIPETTEPSETVPEVTVPEEAEPKATEPVETEPETTEPTETIPEVTEPAETVPEATIPEETEPQVTEPVGTESETTEPTETIPEASEPEETVPEVTVPEEPAIPETTVPEDQDDTETETVMPSSVSAIVLNPGETSTYSSRENMPLSEQILPEKMGSHVIYESVFPGVDLIYENYGYDIKETILVNELQESYAYRFLLEAEGLTASLNESGSITLTDSKGEVIYEIPVPYMFDAAGETSYAVEYSLEEMDGDYILTVTADAAWIEDESRSFPVSIDPTISLKCEYVNDGTLYTTHVVQGDPDEPHNGVPQQYIGYGTGLNWSNNEMIQECQIYAHVAELPGIPEGCEMVEATLQYYMYGDDSAYSHIGCPTLEIAAYPVEQDTSNGDYQTWIKGLTWTDRPAFDNTKLLDFAIASDGTEGTYIQWDVTEQVEKWYADSSITNRTLALVGYESPNYTANHCAVAVLNGFGTNSPPALVVKYRSAIGLESYYTYQNQNIGAAGTAYVSDYTGKLVILKNLVSHASTIMPFSLNMVHNSYYKSTQFKEVSGTGMVFGNGWKLDAVQTLTDCTGDLSNYKLYIDGDGTYHYFLKNGSVWKDEDGLDLTISSVTIKDSSGTSRGSGYQIASGQGDKLCFYKGLLVQQIDSNGNKIFYIYNDTNAGTSGTAWLPDGSGDKLVKVIQQNKGSSTDILLATIAYDSDGRLDTVTDRMENTTKFTYSGQVCTWAINEGKDETVQYKYSSGRLLEAIDKTSRYKIVYEYNNNRISSFTESASSDGTNWTARTKITVEGSRDKTTYRSPGPDGVISNNDDLLTTYLFDDEGRTINSNTTNVDKTIVYGASTGAYATTSTTTPALNNHLMNSASIGTVAVNLLTDSGFEKSSGWELKVADNSGTGTSPVRSADSHRTGSKALKFSRTSSDTGVLRAAQSVTGLTSGQTYTFSAYVNTSGITSFGSDGGIYLKVTSGGSGTGDTLDYTTVSTVDGGWTRLSLTFKATASTAVVNVYGKNFVGTAYIDDMQLEKDDAPSNVNLVTNSEMNGSGSTVTGWTAGTNNVTINTNKGIGSTKAAAIASTPLVQGYLYQDIPLNLPDTQTYVLSGWANADALPSNQPEHPDVKRFALRAEIYYANGTEEDVYLPFSAEIDGEWQFASSVIVPKEDSDVTKIRLYCVYHYNVGTALFDNISLVREPAQTMKYDDNGYLVSVATDGISEDVNSYEGGNLIQTVTQGSGTFDYTYENHNLKTATNGVITQTNTYNTMGNATETELSGTGTSETITTTASYTTDGNHMSTYTDMLNMVYSTAYTNPLNQMYGLPSSTWDQNNVQTVFSYHKDGRTNLQYLRDKESKVEYIRLTNAYDGTKRLTGITRTSGNETNTSTSRTQTYTFGYDVFDQVTTIKVGTRTLTTNTYNSAGNLTKQTFGNGDYVNYQYDELGRVKKTTTEANKTVEYAYNSDGQLASTTSGNLRYDYLYDSLGRLIRSSTHNGSTLKLETRQQYDDSNRLSKQNINLVDSQYEVRYTYNNKGLLTNTSYSSLPDLTYDYDGLQRLTTSENTVRTRTDTYQSGTNLVNKISYTGGSSFTPFDLKYTYDKYGNITKLEAGSVFYGGEYTYDAQGQLLTAKINGVEYEYDYDTAGNLLNITIKNGPSTVSHDYDYGDTNGWVDLLTSFDGVDISYDGNGNPTSYYNGTSWTFGWQNGRELTSASKSGTSISYTYDGDGIRTSKTVDGITYNYIYASGKLLRQTWTESGTAHVMDFFYDEKGAPYALKYDGNTCYYLLNLQGDVIGITTAAGSRYGVYQYDAYGNIIFQSSHSILAKNPLRYRGYVYDQETGFYYLQSRYYDPAIGRFINADAIDLLGANGDFVSSNLFAYSGNNPVIRKDTDGFAWETVFDLISLGTSIIEVSCNPADVGAWVGLVGDIIDVAVPFVAGVGETVRAVNAGRKIADAADNMNDARKVASKIHGNSLSTNKINYGYQLIDKNNNVIKYGESKNPLTRYSQKWLDKNEYKVQIRVAGTKRGVHEWQHDMIENYAIISGRRPELNKSFW